MVPVTEDNCEFFVVGVDFFLRMEEERGAEAVDVLALGRGDVLAVVERAVRNEEGSE